MKGKRFLSVVLVIAQLLMVFTMSSPVSAASARSAKKVLKDIISVKEEWEEATTKRERDKLHEEAEELREELLLTKEYKKDVKVSDRNFLVSKGEDPGFKEMVDVLCFSPYDTKENVEQVLNYLKAYDKSFWGTICIASGGIILTGALIYGVVSYGPTIIAGASMKAAAWETAVANAINAVANETNRIHHILQEKHLWSNLVSNPTWNGIKSIVQDVMLYGNEVILERGETVKELMVSGYLVQIQYNIVNGVLKIVNGWVVSN